MDIIESIILGIIQGLTEWLPISSSGHLAIAQHFMDDVPLVFDIMLHLGTIIVLAYYFRKDLTRVRKGLFLVLGGLRKGKGFTEMMRESNDAKLAIFIGIGIVPTAGIGIFLDWSNIIDIMYDSLLIVGTCLLLTGMILILTARVRGRRNLTKMGAKDAWLIGFAQGIAILPGISRSGSTIGVGLLRGVDAETAGRVSFLLAIPSVVGATLMYIPDLLDGSHAVDLPVFLVGTLVAMVVGYAALALLMRILKGKGFHNFAYYCWAVGILVLVAAFLGY